MFIAALFIIAKIWKQFKYPLTDEWMNVYSIACKWEYKSVIKQTNKQCNNTIYSNMDELGGHYAK